MFKKRTSSQALELHIDNVIDVCRRHGYNPASFVRMREYYGTVEAIGRCIADSPAQSGFNRLRELKVLDWSLEAAVLKFPDEFSDDVKKRARWRIERAEKPEMKNDS